MNRREGSGSGGETHTEGTGAIYILADIEWESTMLWDLHDGWEKMLRHGVQDEVGGDGKIVKLQCFAQETAKGCTKSEEISSKEERENS